MIRNPAIEASLLRGVRRELGAEATWTDVLRVAEANGIADRGRAIEIAEDMASGSPELPEAYVWATRVLLYLRDAVLEARVQAKYQPIEPPAWWSHMDGPSDPSREG